MKKVTLFAVAALALSLASCKKDHTCTCVSTDDLGGGYSYKTTSTIKAKTSKKDGTAWCTNATTTDNSGSTSTTKPTCTLS